jgi:hypothetical protein
LTQQPEATCDDCYFRRAGLCALNPSSPCPTFRLHTKGRFAPPPEPRLAPQLGRLVAQYAAAS